MIPFLIAVAVIGYIVSLWIWPFRPCRACGGTGRNKGSNRRRFGRCRRCAGKGHRQRVGSRTVARAIRAGRSRGQ